MSTRFGALRGGMPLYKYVGNRILSGLQNALLGTQLSEFHSGYRAYSVATLKKLPYRLNTDDFHFDTEIIIQLLHAKQRIHEHPIPTYYGEEISRVNGLRYAKDVMRVTLESAAHRSGVLYERRFDCAFDEGAERYDLKLGYDSSHQRAIDRVPAGARVLDLGGGVGLVARELTKKGCSVTVVDAEARADAEHRIQAIRQDLDDEPQFHIDRFDHVLMLDSIEHLSDPETFLARLREQFDDEARTVVMTTPNIAFIVQRAMLAIGQFNYGRMGILDRTHRRLFTFRSLRRLLDDAGLVVRTLDGVPVPFPKVLGDGALGRLAIAINRALIRVSPTLFSYQIYVEAETRPTVDFMLREARSKSRSAMSTPPEARADDPSDG
jgi:2-polyprenyl-3-methyl-5-hydroxy-6-metoxy-1,4-benzoquinol methylase